MKKKRGPTFHMSFICRECDTSNHTKLAKHRAEAHHAKTGHGYIYRLVIIHVVPRKARGKK